MYIYIHIYQIATPYTLHLHSVIRQYYLNKPEGKKPLLQCLQ